MLKQRFSRRFLTFLGPKWVATMPKQPKNTNLNIVNGMASFWKTVFFTPFAPRFGPNGMPCTWCTRSAKFCMSATT